MTATKTKGINTMEKEQAAWWLACLKALLLNEEVVTICSYEYRGWKPEIRHGMIDKIHQSDFDWGSTLTIHTTDYGLYCGIANLEIRPEDRTVIVTGHTPEGRGYWWVFGVTPKDGGQWRKFKDWADDSWRTLDARSKR